MVPVQVTKTVGKNSSPMTEMLIIFKYKVVQYLQLYNAHVLKIN